MIGRRSILRGIAAVMAAPKMVEAEAAKLIGLQDVAAGIGVGASVNPTSIGLPPTLDESGLMVRQGWLRTAYQIPRFRDELETVMYDAHRQVSYLDVDLANKRSFSMAAKVTFQRQRNVARAIEQDVFDNQPWRRIGRWVDGVLGRK